MAPSQLLLSIPSLICLILFSICFPCSLYIILSITSSSRGRKPETRMVVEATARGGGVSYDDAGGSEGRPPIIPLSIAPMMEWTDRHYRYLMRSLTKRTQLYTEMVVDTTLIHNRDKLDIFLGHHEIEHPVAVQLGGCDPDLVAEAAGICEAFGGYNEINLNVGCPSPRVAERCFGARLMLYPNRVREIVSRMKRQVTSTPVTVKCRIGADDKDSYEDLVGFVTAVRETGVRHLVVHARKCLLEGLTPSQNRMIPPLRYPVVHDLVRDFPDMSIVINGGINDLTQVKAHLCPKQSEELGWTDHPSIGADAVQGVMIGRAAYNYPWSMRNADSLIFGVEDPGLCRRDVVEQYLEYANKMLDLYQHIPNGGCSATHLVKPLHNLFSGEPGGRLFRRQLNDLWNAKGRRRLIDFEEMVTTALENSVSKEQLDELPTRVSIEASSPLP